MKFVKVVKANNFKKSIAERKPLDVQPFKTEDFINFCKSKGYGKSHKISDSLINAYSIDINGYKIEVYATASFSYDTSSKDIPKDFTDIINYSPYHSTGWGHYTHLTARDFSTNEEYFEYALNELIKYADSKLKKRDTTRNYKQNIQDKLNQLKEGKQVDGTAKELSDLLKQLDDSTKLVVKTIL